MLNRSALAIRAKQPFLEWLRKLPDPADVTLEDLNRDPTLYLVPPYEEEEDLERILEVFHDQIFDEELGGWWTDEDHWPEARDLPMFRRWFDVEIHSVVLDLLEEPLDADDLDLLAVAGDEYEDDELADIIGIEALEYFAQLEDLLDREQVRDAVIELFVATDARDWTRVEACFAPQVHVDLTSLAGGDPATMTPAKLTAAWDEGLRDLDAVHHQVGNLQSEVVDEEATVWCHGIASHYLAGAAGGTVRTFVGTYEIHLVWLLDRWAIDSFRFDLKYVEGNAELGQP